MKRTIFIAVAVLAVVVGTTLALRRSEKADPHSPKADSAQAANSASATVTEDQIRSAVPQPSPDLGTVGGKIASTGVPLSRLIDLVESIRGASDPAQRGQLIKELVSSVSTNQFSAVLDHLQKAGGAADVEAELIRAWVKTGPDAAIAWAKGVESVEDKSRSLQNVAIALLANDPQAAQNWMESLPAGWVRNDVALAIAGETVRTDPLAALRLAIELPDGANRNRLAARAIREWAATDPSAAANWALGIKNPALREVAIAESASAWAATDPLKAAEFALANLPNSAILSSTAVEIVQSWAAKDPATAAAWAVNFPEGELRNSALHNVLATWTDSDSKAVAGWIDQLPGGALKDRSVAEYSEALGGRDPVAAIPVAQSIQDQNLRNAKLEVIARRWLDLDATAARQWIQRSSLSKEAITRLLTPPANSPN